MRTFAESRDLALALNARSGTSLFDDNAPGFCKGRRSAASRSNHVGLAAAIFVRASTPVVPSVHARPMSNKKAKKVKIVEDVTGLAIKTTAVALTSGSAVGAALGSTAAAVGALGLLDRLLVERQRDRAKKFLEEAYEANVSDDGFAANIKALLERPAVKQVFIETLRASVEAVADEVLPPLAALFREYERTGRKPDSHFRNFCRLLEQLSPEEYSSFRALFQKAHRSKRFSPVRWLHFCD